MMGMSPNNFWESSPKEIYMAIEGFTEFNSSSEDKSKPMTNDRLSELMELYPDE